MLVVSENLTLGGDDDDDDDETDRRRCLAAADVVVVVGEDMAAGVVIGEDSCWGFDKCHVIQVCKVIFLKNVKAEGGPQYYAAPKREITYINIFHTHTHILIFLQLRAGLTNLQYLEERLKKNRARSS